MPDQSQALVPQQVTRNDLATMSAEEIVLIQGDLSVLTPAQRVQYYGAVCKSLNLNPLTKPFDYIILNGKMVLYAKKDATDQIRDKRHISVDRLERAMIPQSDILTVTAYGHSADGRTDAAIGAVSVRGLAGETLANAMMKAETKAKRRLTLSLAGLGILDETEVGSVVGAVAVTVNDEGEVENKPPATLEEAIERASQSAPAPDGEAQPVAVTPPAPVVSPSPETASAAPVAEPGPETAPEVPADGEFRTPEEADAEAAVVAAPGDGKTGLSFAEFKAMMREKHIFTKEVVDVANRLFPDGHSLEHDLTDDQRLAIILDIVGNRP